MKTNRAIKTAAAIALAAVIAVPTAAFAANTDSTAQQTAALSAAAEQTTVITEVADQTAERQGPMGGGQGGYGGPGGQGGGQNWGGMSQESTSTVSSPTEVVTSELTENSAEGLTADTANAQTITISNSNNQVKISESGTYIITGTCSDGNIAVKKGTTGVVLILKDLDLTSTTGATLSLNKGTEVKVVIEGSVKLTDAENLADEDTEDFDGAAIKAKAGSSVVLTGSGTLTVNGSCKNGIKVSDLDADDANDGYTEASFIIDGALTINVTAANDGINSGTDLTIKSGTINVAAGDDGIKADYILTIGEEGSNGPTIKVTKSEEGLEGATINIYSGQIEITASDDGINAANSDLTGYTYSLNVMGGTVNVSSGADGIDSNGNVNFIGGLTTIVKSANNGGEGGLDYQGSCYIADGTLVNPYGTTMDSGKGGQGGMRGQMPADMGGMRGMPGENWSADGESSATPDMTEAPDMNGAPDAQGGQNAEDAPLNTDDASDNTDNTQSGNWFTRAWESIKNWFSNLFGGGI